MTSGQITDGKECATNALFQCLKRNHIVIHKFQIQESRYFNGLSRQVIGFVARIYLLVTRTYGDHNSITGHRENITGDHKDITGVL